MSTLVLLARRLGDDHTEVTLVDPDQVDGGLLINRVIEVATAGTGAAATANGWWLCVPVGWQRVAGRPGSTSTPTPVKR